MPSSSYYHNSKPREGSPSKRWQTTTRSSLDEVASHLAGNYDRAGMVKGLKDRKLANTKTSISFGTDKVAYISDTMENQLKCSGSTTPEERALQQERIRAMKADLTTTNFRLGDEKPKYLSVNHESMAVAETFHGTGKVQMNDDIKAAVKKSSLHFGNEKVNYQSVAHDSMQYRGNENNFSKLKEEVTEMTATLRKHNFNFGDAKVDYTSDYHRGYGSLPIEAYKSAQTNRGHMRNVIEDHRAAHFSLGNDKPNYESNTHEALRIVEGQAANDVSKQLENARAMKQALVKTSIVIGDDTEYA